VTGVQFSQNGQIHRVGAGSPRWCSRWADPHPKVLMQSASATKPTCSDTAFPVVQHLPGSVQNLQDHPAFGCVWEYQRPLPRATPGVEADLFWRSDSSLDTPDLQTAQGETLRRGDRGQIRPA